MDELPDPFNDPRRRVAFHEAGHAVIALVLDLDVDALWLVDDPDSEDAGITVQATAIADETRYSAAYDDDARHVIAFRDGVRRLAFVAGMRVDDQDAGSAVGGGGQVPGR